MLTGWRGVKSKSEASFFEEHEEVGGEERPDSISSSGDGWTLFSTTQIWNVCIEPKGGLARAPNELNVHTMVI